MTPSPEIIADLKAKHGDRLEMIEAVDPFDGETFSLLVSEVVPKSAVAQLFNDGAAKKTAEAFPNFIAACAVWPSVAEVQAYFDRRPGAAKVVAKEIDALASGGFVKQAIRLEQLSDAEKAQLAAAGFDATVHGKAQLLAFRFDGGIIVARRPSRSSFNEIDRKMGSNEDLAAAFFNVCLDCVVHPPLAEFRPIGDRFPGIPIMLGFALKGHSGEAVEARRKKI